jgi:putative transcriptional regulator
MMGPLAHHPALESLLSCSAGAMPEASAAVIASHVSLCPVCRSELALMEQIGVALLDTIEADTEMSLRPELLANDDTRVATSDEPPIDAPPLGEIPAPLAYRVGASLDQLSWTPVSPGIWLHPIALEGSKQHTLQLYKISGCMALPEHGHGGAERTLVLRGSIIDGGATYRPGDVTEKGEEDVHAPSTGAGGDCICLVAMEGESLFDIPPIRASRLANEG